ncbi:MAG: hypothetical protein JOZ99_02035 [Actinobacteria bacterium]|nr:hypothetical protein [Actinomycetota bacterium]
MARREHPARREAELYFRWLLGDDWEQCLADAGALVPPDDSADALLGACERAIDVAHHRRADLDWSDDRDELLREAWWLLHCS